ncbi:MAG: hypothetical protein ABI193_12025, partial [Minicystis sp.]
MSTINADEYYELRFRVEPDDEWMWAQGVIVSTEEFVRLYESSDPKERWMARYDVVSDDVCLDVINRYPDLAFGVACNQTLSPSILRVLAHDSDSRARTVAANREQVEPAVLEMLARDSEVAVRIGVVSNAATPEAALIKLSNDPDDYVRSLAITRLRRIQQERANALRASRKDLLAACATEPDEAWLVILEQDREVKQHAARRKTSPIGLLRVLAGDTDPMVRSTVASARRTEATTLERLADDDDPAVRRAVACNRNTPDSALLRLASDTVDRVA